MMQEIKIEESRLRAVLEDVVGTVFHHPVLEWDGAGASPVLTWEASVEVGSPAGVVVKILCNDAFGSQLVRLTTGDEGTEEAVAEGLAEVASMLGGHLKACIPGYEGAALVAPRAVRTTADRVEGRGFLLGDGFISVVARAAGVES